MAEKVLSKPARAFIFTVLPLELNVNDSVVVPPRPAALKEQELMVAVATLVAAETVDDVDTDALEVATETLAEEPEMLG